MKETTKKFIYLQLDTIKNELKDDSSYYTKTATNECYKLRGMLQYMRYNDDITHKEYKSLNEFSLKLLRLARKREK